jgi:hypothetical protein
VNAKGVIAALIVSNLLSGVALGYSITHAGPQGPTGPTGPRGAQGQQGNTGQNAEVAHLGMCFSITTLTVDSTVIVTGVNLYSPVLTDGVPGCPSGSFVSVVPESG